MRRNNKGCEFEQYIQRILRAEDKSRKDLPYDLETIRSVYEVKGASLFVNANVRKGKESCKFGRYFINTDNHSELKKKSEELGKLAKYVFCLKLSKRIYFRVLTWEKVDDLLKMFRCKQHKDGRNFVLVPLRFLW